MVLGMTMLIYISGACALGFYASDNGCSLWESNTLLRIIIHPRSPKYDDDMNPIISMWGLRGRSRETSADKRSLSIFDDRPRTIWGIVFSDL